MKNIELFDSTNGILNIFSFFLWHRKKGRNWGGGEISSGLLEINSIYLDFVIAEHSGSINSLMVQKPFMIKYRNRP